MCSVESNKGAVCKIYTDHRAQVKAQGSPVYYPWSRTKGKVLGPLSFALRWKTTVTEVNRRIDVAIIVVKLRYSRRFSSKIAPFLG